MEIRNKLDAHLDGDRPAGRSKRSPLDVDEHAKCTDEICSAKTFWSYFAHGFSSAIAL
jgi:hypothetical protein